ncbi:effector of murein hydrolase LrgA [Levilactobacillus hammesii DSM 16381]|uniref:Effector of murein hydrolase LrgA n=1 Tax=Levilactobacillus hammesii DSM 16381 TaxID=1423753 RepID=A0A0R1UQC2_9LACO|nr:effector of murein hydrolase LrgA [Levilactobacillus hammesii DSM 16381]
MRLKGDFILAQQHPTTQPETAGEQPTPILGQMSIFAAILFVASLISPLFPASLPVPTPVIGIVILYTLLATHILKLRNVEKFADFMISLIAFLFVPAGVQLAASLDILKAQGLQITAVVLIATIVMLVLVSYTAVGLIWLRQHLFHRKSAVEQETTL